MIVVLAFLITFISSPIGNPSLEEPLRVLFFGDSITAGYGIESESAYPALLQQKVDSLGWEVEMINGGLSGETSAGGLRRIDWMLRKPVDIFVLELGGNDGLRGLDLTSTQQNLQAIIDKVLDRNASTRIIIAGMQVPPNLGDAYTKEFSNLFPTLAERNSLPLIPFILEGVAGDPTLNLPDGIHPTAKGHKRLAENVWKTLRPILQAELKKEKPQK